MKLLTFWLVCCVGLLYSGGCVDGFNGNRRRASGSPNRHQPKAPAPATTRTDENPNDWFIQTFTGSRVRLYPIRIIIPKNFFQTECPPWMHGVYSCFIFYYHPETTNNNVPPATTGLNDKIATTTQASEVAEIPDEEVSIGNRFGLKVDFNDYYNTKTGVDLKIVKPLRKPTITIPPSDHSSGASEISSKKRPSSTTQGKESNNVEPSVYTPVPTTRRPRTTKNTRRTTVTQPKTTPSYNDDGDDSINFDDTNENTPKPRPLKRNTPTAARETSTTTSPLIPCTNGKIELNRNNQKDMEDRILFNNEEKGDLSDLERAIKECCKQTGEQGCLESKGFKFDKNLCLPLQRG